MPTFSFIYKTKILGTQISSTDNNLELISSIFHLYWTKLGMSNACVSCVLNWISIRLDYHNQTIVWSHCFSEGKNKDSVDSEIFSNRYMDEVCDCACVFV